MSTDDSSAADRGSELSDLLGQAPTRADVDALMKRCQIGVGGRNALDEAHSIMADCYGMLGRQQIKIERLRRALHEIAEEWAGAECGEPVTAQEGYAIGLARRMYKLAAEAKSGVARPCLPAKSGG